MVKCNRVAAYFDIFQESKTDPIDIAFRCFRWVYPNERLKKVPVRVSRYFCVQSSSDSRSASRPMTVITPRTTFTASIKSPPNQYAYKSFHRSFRSGVPDRRAFPRFHLRSSRSRAMPALHLRSRQTLWQPRTGHHSFPACPCPEP